MWLSMNGSRELSVERNQGVIGTRSSESGRDLMSKSVKADKLKMIGEEK